MIYINDETIDYSGNLYEILEDVSLLLEALTTYIPQSKSYKDALVQAIQMFCDNKSRESIVAFIEENTAFYSNDVVWH